MTLPPPVGSRRLDEWRLFRYLLGAVVSALLVDCRHGVAAQEEPDGEWRMAAKNYANTRFSSLDEINVGNAQQLEVAWTSSTALVRGLWWS